MQCNSIESCVTLLLLIMISHCRTHCSYLSPHRLPLWQHVHSCDFDPTGPAFTVIYVVAGLPLARLADTRSRPFVLLLGLVMWSVMIFLTGFTVTFWQLLTLRIFLGIGEVPSLSLPPSPSSTLLVMIPLSHSPTKLLTLIFPPHRLHVIRWPTP